MRPATPLAITSVAAYTIPTDAPEADGTFAWTSTTMIVVQAEAGGASGLGYTYTDASAAGLIRDTLAPVVDGSDAQDPPACFRAMRHRVRNIGRGGLAATAISAVDVALWDLKARLLDLPLATLLGRARDEIVIYGSGGFTSYDDARLAAQLSGWVERDGCSAVKMKIGADPERDPHRVARARAAIGQAELFVDANGAFTPSQAIRFARSYAADADVRWFEEPVSSDHLAGLRQVRRAAPPSMEIAAGEYGYDLDYFRHMLAADAIDVQQADATRCGGVTGFMRAAALCDAFHTDLSAHCAPSLHLHLGCAAPRWRNLEWFHDHVRIEHMLFDGAPIPHGGKIRPDPDRAGLGLVFRQQDAAGYEVGA